MEDHTECCMGSPKQLTRWKASPRKVLKLNLTPTRKQTKMRNAYRGSQNTNKARAL